MAFSVQDFRDLLRLLDEHPEWKAELRRSVLADDMLELPRIVRELAEAQRRTEERLETLTARVDALTAQVEELAEAQRRTEVRLGRLENQVARLNGSDLERSFRERAASLIRRPYRRARALPFEVVSAELDEAVDRGSIAEADADEALLADAFVEARDAEGPLWLVVEVSSRVDVHDIERAVRRADILSRTGRRARPAVAGYRMTEGANAALEASGAVWLRVPDAMDEAN